MFRVGLDLCGADRAPHVLFQALLLLPLPIFQTLSFVAYATKHDIALIQKKYRKQLFDRSTITFCECDQVITMDEEPLDAVRAKKKSTLMCGLKDHKQGLIDAFISCANTGALVAASVVSLKMLPHISRPALIRTLPAKNRQFVILDLGANLTCTPEQLVEFAYLGTSFCTIVRGIRRPKLCLLNIGQEAAKGTHELRLAWNKLIDVKNPPFDFLGNKEPEDLLKGTADVCVTSGFTGNIFVKTLEAFAQLVGVKTEGGFGAILYGVNGLVVKCHGNSDAVGIKDTIVQLHTLLEKKLLKRTVDFFSKQIQ